MKRLIVSRHRAAIEFVAEFLGGRYVTEGWNEVRIPIQTGEPEGEAGTWETVPVVGNATVDDVCGNIVYGNLPLHLAALAAEVWAVEFEGAPPRGQEYDLAAMKAAGARLVPYKVYGRAQVAQLQDAAHSDGYGPDPWCLVHFSDEPNPYDRQVSAPPSWATDDGISPTMNGIIS